MSMLEYWVAGLIFGDNDQNLFKVTDMAFSKFHIPINPV